MQALGLASRVNNDVLTEAAALLADRDVPALVRRLYYSYCSEILAAIGDGTRIDLPERVGRFMSDLGALLRNHQSSCVFTLNYDLLLDRMLISEDMLGLAHEVTDFFSGYAERQIEVDIPDYGRPTGRLFYPQDPPRRPIHLHHLHGCLTHFAANSGIVFKLSNEVVRDSALYSKLAEFEDLGFYPAVILGSKKANKATTWPYVDAFNELEAAGHDARTLLIAGYSMRDNPVNSRLREIATRSTRIRFIVVDLRAPGGERDAFIELTERTLGVTAERIEFHFDGIDRFVG